MKYKVLLISEGVQELEKYSRALHEVVSCQIDLAQQWSPRQGDHLVVILTAQSGLTTLENIKRCSPMTSVILVVQTPVLEDAVAAIRMGAEDYLRSDVSWETFQASVRRSLNKKDLLFNAAEPFHQWAFLDHATGLYNTRYLDYVLDREILRSQETQKSFGLLFIDADDFKLVNDLYGHRIGTRLLHALGIHLKKKVREVDSVFRYGGDEFVAVLPSCDLEAVIEYAREIQRSVERKVFLKEEGLSLQLTVSIGISVFPIHAQSQQAMLEAADLAMYRAKKLKSCKSMGMTGCDPLLRS